MVFGSCINYCTQTKIRKKDKGIKRWHKCKRKKEMAKEEDMALREEKGKKKKKKSVPFSYFLLLTQ
jgi:hypothetical protein